MCEDKKPGTKFIVLTDEQAAALGSDIAEAYQEYAELLGKNVDDLSQTEKQQAALNWMLNTGGDKKCAKA